MKSHTIYSINGIYCNPNGFMEQFTFKIVKIFKYKILESKFFPALLKVIDTHIYIYTHNMHIICIYQDIIHVEI